MSIAKSGDIVKVHYTGRLKDGTQFDSSVGNDPLEFDLGAGQVIEGFEEAIIGMKQGEKKTIEIPVDKAYGPVIEDYILKTSTSHLPHDLEPFIGMQLLLPTPNGESIPVTIVDIEGEEITLDANHQLAGQDLIFDLELVGVLSNWLIVSILINILFYYFSIRV